MKGLLRPQARAFLGGLIGIAVAALMWTGALDLPEDMTVDWRLRFRKPPPISPDVRLVAIGDADVTSLVGCWPFPRALHADALKILSATSAKHVTLDILLVDPSPDLDHDNRLKQVIEHHHDVTLAYHFEEASPAKHRSPTEDRSHFVTDASRYGLDVSDLRFVRGHLPVAPFAHMKASYGAVNAVPDVDGVIRRVPLFFVHRGRLYPSLAMETVIAALGLRNDQINVTPGKEVTLVDTERGTLHIPIDAQGQYRVNFVGDLGAFTPAFEYRDLYDAVQSPEIGARLRAALAGRFVLVGVAITGHADLIPTSLGLLPGVAVHATVLSNILAGNYLVSMPSWLQISAIVLAASVLGISMPATRPWVGIAVYLAIAVVWTIATLLAASANVLLPLVPVLAAISLATLVLLSVEVVGIKRDRSRVIRLLGRYIAAPVLQRLVHTDQITQADSERREVTILFADIRGFTSWTDRVEPDEVAARLNEYFAAMTCLVEDNGGTLDKLIGDSVMAFFGAPVADEQHALHAVQTAISMQHAMERLNESWAHQGYDRLQIGVGIHTGHVTVGSFGSTSFLDFTVIGRAVNVAARIASEAEGGTVLLSARSHSLIRDHVRTASRGHLSLKGIREPQFVFQVMES